MPRFTIEAMKADRTPLGEGKPSVIKRFRAMILFAQKS